MIEPMPPPEQPQSENVEGHRDNYPHLTPTPMPLDGRRKDIENPWPTVIDKNLHEAIETYRETQERKDRVETELIGIDKQILLVFAIALLGTLFFTFYLIAVDKLSAVTNVLYPIITLILGFMSGYFAGTGRSKGRGK